MPSTTRLTAKGGLNLCFSCCRCCDCFFVFFWMGGELFGVEKGDVFVKVLFFVCEDCLM